LRTAPVAIASGIVAMMLFLLMRAVQPATADLPHGQTLCPVPA
jgi:hypothetical protein